MKFISVRRSRWFRLNFSRPSVLDVDALLELLVHFWSCAYCQRLTTLKELKPLATGQGCDQLVNENLVDQRFG